jgi:hypothetical protein
MNGTKTRGDFGATEPMIADCTFLSHSTLVAHKRPAPQGKPAGKREVSIDGVNYIDYDKMEDSDPFEKYPYHRVRTPDGKFSIDERPIALATSSPHCFTCGAEGPVGYKSWCFPCTSKKENDLNDCRRENGDRKDLVTRVPPTRPPIQSHSMLWGGVFSLR